MGEPTAEERAALEAAKRASVAQLLLKCARLLNEQAIARVRERAGVPNLRPAHTTLFPHIDLEGTRITEIARRVGISKQAVAQLVDELEAMGGVERVPDPSDGRAKLVRFAHKRGKLSLLDGLEHLRALEGDMEAAIGSPHMQALRDALCALHDALESGMGTGTGAGTEERGPLTGWRS
jgi:DNA-binding MarR family transcriptional regulator